MPLRRKRVSKGEETEEVLTTERQLVTNVGLGEINRDPDLVDSKDTGITDLNVNEALDAPFDGLNVDET